MLAMKKLLFLTVGAFLTAALLSYSFKKQPPAILTPECYVSCFTAETVAAYTKEASTKEFASWHPDPLQYKLDDPTGKMISMQSADGKDAWAYEIKSEKKNNKNYILVIQEWWGLNDHIKREAEWLADKVEHANILALDMYDGKVASTPDSAMKYMQGATADRLTNIIKAAIKHAGPDANIYTIGWCFGGMWSLQAALIAGPQAKGCVMYYGRPELNVEKLKTLNTDVIGFFGNNDKSPSPELVSQFETAMKAAGKTLYRNSYDNAGHGFANPSNPAFNKDATEDAREKTKKYLKERMEKAKP
jgi:carboxymethylenebutenolidase